MRESRAQLLRPLSMQVRSGWPVSTVFKAGDFDEALSSALDSPYAPTGGIYSRSPAHLARAQREFRVLNLGLNRTIISALVDGQPLGGLGLSGRGSRTHSPDYLLPFMEPRAITQRTLRAGFVPNSGQQRTSAVKPKKKIKPALA